MSDNNLKNLQVQIVSKNVGSDSIKNENLDKTEQENSSIFASDEAYNSELSSDKKETSSLFGIFSEKENNKKEGFSAGAELAKKAVETLLEGQFDRSAEGIDDDVRIKWNSACDGSKFEKIAGDLKDRLDGETKDGEIGPTRQHATGDCWILSGVNSLSYTEEGRKLIKEALEYTEHGTVVHLKGAGDYFIPDELVKQTKGSTQYSSGDDDMIILELAIEGALDDIRSGRLELRENAPWYIARPEEIDKTKKGQSSTKGGWNAEAIYLLTGKKSRFYDYNDVNMDTLLELEDKDNVALGGGFKEDITVKDVNGNDVELHDYHAYAIKELKDGKITLVNPWNSGEDIILDYETYLNAKPDMTVTRLSSIFNPKYLMRPE